MSEEGRRGAAYDRFARNYERVMRPLERLGLGRLRARVLAEVPDGARVLEVGAGTGLNFPFYPRACTHACVEPSREMLALARAKAERPEGALLVQARAEELPFGAGAFDAAFATLGYCFDALNRITVPLFEDHFNRRTAEEARGAGLHVERVDEHLLGVVQLIV